MATDLHYSGRKRDLDCAVLEHEGTAPLDENENLQLERKRREKISPIQTPLFDDERPKSMVAGHRFEGCFLPRNELETQAPCLQDRDVPECTKHPGHEGFIPLKDLTLDHLPFCWRDQTVLDKLLFCSKTVVKVTMSPFGARKIFVASGRAFVSRADYSSQHATRTSDNSDSDSENAEIPTGNLTFYVSTAAHVVGDDCEAKKATITFFDDYTSDDFLRHQADGFECVEESSSSTCIEKNDKFGTKSKSYLKETFKRVVPSQPIVNVIGLGENPPYKNFDVCFLKCTTDHYHLKKVLLAQPPAHAMKRLPFGPNAPPREPLAIAISHPHGQPRQVSFGVIDNKWTHRKSQLEKTLRTLEISPGMAKMKVSEYLENWKGSENVEIELSKCPKDRSILEQYMRNKANPELTFKELLQEMAEMPDVRNALPTCPGSSGAPVLIFRDEPNTGLASCQREWN